MTMLASLPLRIGARILARRFGPQPPRPGSSLGTQQRVLGRLLHGWAGTRFGRDHGLNPEMDYEAFCNAVPVRGYEGFTDYIERMRGGEPDELWPGRCRHFAVSSGTTAGPTKHLPVNSPMLDHFRRAGLQSLLLHAARVGHTRVFGGRQLFLGGATALERISPAGAPAVWAGDLSGITAAHLPLWADAMLYEPGRKIALIEDWPGKIEAIAERTIARDVRLVAGIPSWLLILFEALERRARARGMAWRGLRSIWPNLECLVHGGVPLGPYAAQLSAATGPDVSFHEVFPASEGFIAAQDGESGAGLRVLDDVGLFFECLPADELDASGHPRPGACARPLAACRTGEIYALVMSTPAGLCRYLIGDLVRMVSIDPPRFVYAGRTTLQLSAFGEHVIEEELTDALVATARRHEFSIAHFHAAPLFPDPQAGRDRGCHEWWIELAGGTAGSSNLVITLDQELQRRNDDYAAKRRGGGLALPVVRPVAAGSFEAWLKANGRWGGQNKVPRCRSDRRVADALASLSTSTTRP